MYVCCVSLLIVFFGRDTMASDEVAKNFEEASIVPDCLDNAPSAKITVTYPGNKEISWNILTPTDVKSQPKVSWDANSDHLYTLSMVDPDAPSRATPTFREINHWLVVNIKGNDLSTGQTLCSYRGSGPPKGSGLHRYVFLVFKQPDLINVTEENLGTDRRNFSIRKFAQKYSLGNAIAGNFYQAEWDSSVPERKP